MNRVPLSTLAVVFDFTGAITGIPSLTVLLLSAINEIRNSANASPQSADLNAASNSIQASLGIITAHNHSLIIWATTGFIVACGCWLIARELKVINFHSNNSRRSVSNPHLTASIRG